MHRLSLSAATIAALLAAGACAGPSTDAVPVAVATTTPLGSVVGDIAACGGATSTTLMGPGDDPHTFAASSAQVAEMARSGLVVANGLGLEEGLRTSIAGAAQDGVTVLEIAPLVDPIEFGESPLEAGESHEEHAHGSEDPHIWLDVARMAAAAELVGEALASETGDPAFRDCGAEVRDSLRETDAQVREILATIPVERRVLITDHASFGYFVEAYAFEVGGVVVPGGSTDAEPSSAQLAALVELVRGSGTPALFASATAPSSLVEAVAAEAGTEVVELYVESLGPEGSGAESYATMMLTNARRIAEALG